MAGIDKLTGRKLSIGYQNGSDSTAVASDLHFSLKAGEFVCLLGPNGAGKSTMIRTLAGMQPSLGGELSIGEQSLQSIPPRQRARTISVVLTETMPSGMMDAYSLVSLGRHPYSGWFGGLNDADHKRIEWAIDAVGAKNLASRQVSELSDGERQKVSIARALAQESEIMLLDEPTAFLDLPRRVELMSILRNLAHRENMALLLSTHDLDLALRFADRLWLMTPKGELLQGAPEALAMSGEFADVFASENLDWDTVSGSFRTHPTPCLNVYLEGQGVEFNWTQRALERLGFGLTSESRNSAFGIHIESSQWIVTHEGNKHSFSNIESLIEWIDAKDWTVAVEDR